MLDKIKEDQVPFNTILFSDERILTEHEKHTVLEYDLLFSLSDKSLDGYFRNKNASDNPSGQTPYRDENIDYCKSLFPLSERLMIISFY